MILILWDTYANGADLPSSFIIGDAVCDAPIEIAGKFCEYFSNIGPKLAEKIPNSNDTYTRFLPPKNVNSLFLDPASSQEIIHNCNSLRPGVAAGYDNIPIGIVKETIDLISDPPCHIISLSITSGVVPDQLKITRVIPIFKTGDKRIFSNYRPVSALPIFSKLFERVIYNRLLNFLNKLSILSKNQFGFRKNHSTSLALILLYEFHQLLTPENTLLACS